jgi:hypothetical protein
MSILSTDLVAYLSANVPVADSGTVGGAIDTLRRADYTQLTQAGGELVKFVSSNAGDTSGSGKTATLVGRKTDGTLATETINLNGTTPVNSTNTYERILSVDLAATCAGTITVSGNTSTTTFRVIPIGERGFKAIFQQNASDPATQKDYYQKFFWKNTNGTLALTVAQVVENADPSAVVTHGLGAGLDDVLTSANRVTAPAGVTFANTAALVPNSQNLSSGSAIGVWLHLTLAAGNAALKTTYTSEIDGQTT